MKNVLLVLSSCLFHLSGICQNNNVLFLCSEKNCSIEIKGKTNAGSYSCNFMEVPYMQAPAKATAQYENGKLSIKGLKILLASSGFVCDNKKMTADFKETLKTESYPKLEIEFLELHLEKKLVTQHLQKKVKAKVAFTIAGVRKTYQVVFDEVDMQKNTVEIRGKIPLKMTDFNLDPPIALFGLVKANDQIDVDFTMQFCIE